MLLSVFQQNHQRSIESWTTHSLAVKAAFQLGLHSPASQYYDTVTESEIHKRLWYCIINQDRYVSSLGDWIQLINHEQRLLAALLGRPFLIAPQYVRVSSPDIWESTFSRTRMPESSWSRLEEQSDLLKSLMSVYKICFQEYPY